MENTITKNSQSPQQLPQHEASLRDVSKPVEAVVTQLPTAKSVQRSSESQNVQRTLQYEVLENEEVRVRVLDKEGKTIKFLPPEDISTMMKEEFKDVVGQGLNTIA